LIAPSSALAVTESFSAAGKEQSFVVPAGVYRVNVLAVGASGAASAGAGGSGAQVTGELEVTPGETLFVEVGGNGSGVAGGFNGGGSGAGGGGGASDIRTTARTAIGSLSHRVLVAGGGGGSASSGEETTGGAGGAAGEKGFSDSFGENPGGGPGTATAGGAGALGTIESGSSGELGVGGAGGVALVSIGGGGGGGLYGGGGGGAGNSFGGGGGGGGSSLVPPGGSLKVATAGTQPQIQISYTAAEGFSFTGGEQTFTVPAGVTTVHVDAIGGYGGDANGAGGAPARVTGDLAVTPGETLYVEVAGDGSSTGAGGFNGGATGAGGGGGASDVRTSPRSAGLSPDTRVLVAAGGGGSASNGEATEGGGGGAAGQKGLSDSGGENVGGGPGSAGAGGSGAFGTIESGSNGVLGVGGAAGVALVATGGGGGGGVYGGGGGGAGNTFGGGGGGGGSSLVPAGGSVALAGPASQPQVHISYTVPTPSGGGSTPTGSGSQNTTNTLPVISYASQSSARWREGSALAQISAKHAPVGTVFSFSLNEAATVTLSFVQTVTGRKAGRVCVRQTSKNRKKHACKLSLPAGTITFSGHAGVNKVRFAGRISASKKLKLGSYVLGIRAVNAQGKRSVPKLLRFTIVK
jgi:hypothetical protein